MYIIDFSVVSFMYLTITTIFYFKQNKIQNNQTRIFNVLLILGECSLLLDIFAAIIDQNMSVSIPFIYIINFLFLFCVQLNGPLFLGYVLVLTGLFPKIKKKYRFLMLIPFGIIFVLLILSFFTKYGVFYLDDHTYMHGKTHYALYFIIAMYIISALIIAIVKFGKIQKKKIIPIFSFVSITFVAMIIQAINPDILFNSTGNALSLTVMCLALQTPDENIDSLTRLLNKASFKSVITDFYEQNQEFNMFLFTLNDFGKINQEYGIKSGDDLMIAFSLNLQKHFSKAYIFRIIGDVYGVVDFSSKETLESVKDKIPFVWNVHENQIKLDVSIIALKSKDFMDKNVFLSIINYIIYKHDSGINKTLIVDEEYIKEYEYYQNVEKALEKAVNEKTLEVYYQPIHDSSGKLVAFEALSRLITKELGFVSPELFIGIAEKNGLIYRLGEVVLEKVCEFINEYHVEKWNLHHIGVNLSVLQCTNPLIYEKLMEIMDKYNIPNKIISFEITETSSTTEMQIVKEKMNLFIKSGYNFMLDDFGCGYANYNYVLDLPFTCIKIDKSILWQAMKNKKDMLYLETLANALNKLNLFTICEGVETLDQAETLKKLGITMQQGYLYSKALSKEDAYLYSQKN